MRKYVVRHIYPKCVVISYKLLESPHPEMPPAAMDGREFQVSLGTCDDDGVFVLSLSCLEGPGRRPCHTEGIRDGHS